MYEATLPFSGFYGSIHDNTIDWVIESELESLNLNYDQADLDCSEVFLAYAQYYTNWVSTETDIPIVFEKLVSPREYNFETDRIYIQLDDDTVRRLHAKYVNDPAFAKRVEDIFTPCSGWIPFYSADIEDWKTQDWDRNQIGILFEHHLAEIGFKEEVPDLAHEVVLDHLKIERAA